MNRPFAPLLIAAAASGGCRACSNSSDYAPPLARSSYGPYAQDSSDYQATSGIELSEVAASNAATDDGLDFTAGTDFGIPEPPVHRQ
jgi:hypothetical protein